MPRIATSLLLIIFLTANATSHANTVLTKIRLQDHSGAHRTAWPITGGIPLPKGMLRDISKVGLLETPCQTRVLSRWSDGSIKWALLDFQTDMAAGQTKRLTVIKGDPAPATGNVVTENTDGITVDTGALKFSVSKNAFSFIREAWFDTNRDGDYNDPGEQVITADAGQRFFFDVQQTPPQRPGFTYRARDLKTGQSHSVANSTPTVTGGPIWMRPQGGGSETAYTASHHGYAATIREHGPFRTVIELKGRFPSTTSNDWEGSTYSIWIHAFKEKSFIRVQHNFLLKGDPGVDFIRRMGLELPLNFSGAATFRASGLPAAQPLSTTGESYLLNSGPQDVFHLYYDGFNLPWEVRVNGQSTTGLDKTAGFIDISGTPFGVTAVFKDMAYLYPKELSFDAQTNKLTAWIWPNHGDLVMDMNATGWRSTSGKHGMQGVSFTHDLYYHFHTPDQTSSIQAFASHVNDPLQPYVNPTWYSHRGTKAAGMIMPPDSGQFPKTEAYLATGTAFIERSMIDFGWLGMLNFGDIMQDYSYNESGSIGTWGLSDRSDNYGGWRHGNTMLSYRMLMQYLRTGDTHFWRMTEAHIKHVRDVLIKHYNAFRDQLPDEMQWTGMGRRHSAYWGASTDIDQHSGVAYEGYGTNWLGILLHWNLTGDWRSYDVLDEIRSAWHEFGDNQYVAYLYGSAFVGLKLLGGVPGHEAAINEAEAFKTAAVSTASQTTNAWRDCTWFFGYGLYLQDYAPDPDIHQALLTFAQQDPGRDQWGLFWHRDALSTIYWAMTDNQPMRDAIYQKLYDNLTERPDNPPSAELSTQQQSLLSQNGIEGLFTTEIHSLAQAVTNLRYWRLKDDLIQLQWDAPLSMAVIDYHVNGSQKMPPRPKQLRIFNQ